MYVILTSKPGQFHTEIGDAFRVVETYDYNWYGKKKARFVIAEQVADEKVRIVDEGLPPLINLVPAKFFEKFPTVQRARAELEHLTKFGSMQTTLDRVS